jgi:hypothetical protein
VAILVRVAVRRIIGVAWLVNGETLFKDAAAPDQAVPAEAVPTQAVPVDATAADGAAPDGPIPAT